MASSLKSTTGETDLSTLLKTITPILNEGQYIFASVTVDEFSRIEQSQVVGMFREAEGITVIVKRDYAETMNFKFDFIAAWITLTVHSSLEASGLTAAFSKALAEADISCNVMAAFYHDHIFVPFDKAHAALEALKTMSSNQN